MRASLIVAVFALAGPVSAQTFSPEALANFETRVRPLLRASCEACHSANNRSGGLALDSREAVLQGGKRGPAVKPGAPDESLLIEAVEQTGAVKMPMAKPRLKPEEIAILRDWVSQNLPWAVQKQTQPRNWDHWSFQTPKRETPPQVTARVLAEEPDR